MMRVISKTPHAEAWRAARPNAKCNDSSAGELVRRELRWLDDVREREAEERRAQSGPLDMLFGGFNSGVMPDMMFAESEPDETNEQRSAAPQKAKRCEGLRGQTVRAEDSRATESEAVCDLREGDPEAAEARLQSYVLSSQSRAAVQEAS